MTTLLQDLDEVTGEDIANWMSEHGWETDIQLARALGVARTTVFNWRHGQHIKDWVPPALDGLAAHASAEYRDRRGPVKLEVEVDPESGRAEVVRSRRLARAR